MNANEAAGLIALAIASVILIALFAAAVWLLSVVV